MAEHLIAKGMLKPEALSLPVKASTAPRGTAAKAGWREIGGQRFYGRSAWEANTARWLEFLRAAGEIASWSHEKTTYWFEKIKRGTRSYLPDFEVVELSGVVKVYETKGHFDSRSVTKLKRMRKYYPSVPVVLVGKASHQEIAERVGAEFVSYRGLVRTAGPLIGGWE